MKALILLLSCTPLIFFSCGGGSKKQEDNREIEKLKSELNLAVSIRETLGFEGSTVEIDSLKLLLAVKLGKEKQSKFDAFADSLAIIRLVESYNWVTSTGGNPIDGEWKFAMTTDNLSGDSENFLKLEQHDNKVWLLFMGSYFCDDNPIVDMAFKVDGVDKVYKIRGGKTSDSKAIIIHKNFLQSEFLKDFKLSESVYMRVNESHCDTEMLELLMTGATVAVDHFNEL